ncbi:MAG: hypothetical protein M1132_05330 [Chloroflexi bacterium]|nr:hypothetical protein [Chloroflexota bacterium]
MSNRRGKGPEWKFYLSNAQTTCPHSEFIRLSRMRWPEETALEEAKGQVGMDQCETRSWVGWHHQMAHGFLAHLLLVHLCLVFKKSPTLTIAQARELIAQALEDECPDIPSILI